MNAEFLAKFSVFIIAYNLLLGLLNHRHAPEHTSQMLPIEIKAEIFSLYNANPAFSYREIARIVSEKYHRNIDHKSVKKVIYEGEAYIQYQKKRR